MYALRTYTEWHQGYFCRGLFFHFGQRYLMTPVSQGQLGCLED